MTDTPATSPTVDEQPTPLMTALVQGTSRLIPGLILAGIVSAAAMALHSLPGFGWASPLILAIIIGVLVNSALPLPVVIRPGLAFSLKRLLRIGVALLGLQVTLAQVATLGISGVVVIAVALGGTFLFTLTLGRLLGVPRNLTRLIAAGTSICGASAVVAADAVVEAEDADVAYAVGMVTLFGTISMLAFPVIGTTIGLNAHDYGLWTGSAIHEVAQVVAAAYQHGTAAGDMGTIAKLTRVMMLVPVILLLGVSLHRERQAQMEPDKDGADGVSGKRAKIPMPWFAVGFLILTGVASMNILPTPVLHGFASLDQILLTVALAAMGLSTHLGSVLRRGLRPLVLSAAASVCIACLALGGVLITQ